MTAEPHQPKAPAKASALEALRARLAAEASELTRISNEYGAAFAAREVGETDVSDADIEQLRVRKRDVADRVEGLEAAVSRAERELADASAADADDQEARDWAGAVEVGREMREHYAVIRSTIETQGEIMWRYMELGEKLDILSPVKKRRKEMSPMFAGKNVAARLQQLLEISLVSFLKSRAAGFPLSVEDDRLKRQNEVLRREEDWLSLYTHRHYVPDTPKPKVPPAPPAGPEPAVTVAAAVNMNLARPLSEPRGRRARGMN